MDILDIIAKKRDKGTLSRDEIHFFIKNYVDGSIKDYQASALLMAIYLNGMNNEEISILTDEMMHSGEVMNLDSIEGIKVDKHSTGGVGDKVSLILGPMIASAGAKLAKMSGRGLGHTGGTLDKLESIPGMRINLSKDEFIQQVKKIGISIIGQNSKLVPADKKIYALRDVTSTIGSIPLIASSVMSKKLASGSDAILLDVKYGSGAFMKDIDSAKELAITMVNIGKHLNKDVKAEVTPMDQPLGLAVGNNLEIKEVIATLKGNGPKDLFELCIDSGAIMLMQAKITKTKEEGVKILQENIKNGKAFDKFVEFVNAQGGDVSYILDPSKFEMAKNIVPIYSKKSGYINRIDAMTIGISSMRLGGGRETLDDIIDMSAGIVLNKKLGDEVRENELLCTIYTNKTENDYLPIIENVYNSFKIDENLIYKKEEHILIE